MDANGGRERVARALEMRRLAFGIGCHTAARLLSAVRIPYRECVPFETDIQRYTELILSDHRYIGSQRRHCRSVKLSTLPSMNEPLGEV